MKKSQFTPEQITFALRQTEAGTPVPEVCRKMGITDQTFYRWKKKYLGTGIAELRRLRVLEEENRKLKQLVADLSLDKQMLQDVLRKKHEACSVPEIRYQVKGVYGVNERRVCPVLLCPRSSYQRKSTRDEQATLRIRTQYIAYSEVSYGYRRIRVLLKREGWQVNHKRVYWLYRLEGLRMRPKRYRRHVTGCRRMERVIATYPNECWSMDFMSDELYNGQRIRLLTLVDNFSRESLAVIFSFPEHHNVLCPSKTDSKGPPTEHFTRFCVIRRCILLFCYVGQNDLAIY